MILAMASWAEGRLLYDTNTVYHIIGSIKIDRFSNAVKLICANISEEFHRPKNRMLGEVFRIISNCADDIEVLRQRLY